MGLIIYIITSKLDLITRRDWETYRYEGDMPTMKDLNNLLKSKCEILEKLEVSCQNNSGNSDKWGKSGAKFGNSRKHSTVCSSTEARDINLKCYYCSKAHSIYKCESFLNLAVNDRIAEFKRHKLCLNCLGNSHHSSKCTRPKCYKCKRAHNSLLHSESYNKVSMSDNNFQAQSRVATNGDNNERSQEAGNNQIGGSEVLNPSINAQVCAVAKSDLLAGYSQVLLSTALIELVNGTRSITVRALLDNGSQSHFISQEICNKLNLKYSKINHAVKGVGQTLTNINNQVNISIKSRISNFKININCLVLSRISDKLPTISLKKELLKIPSSLQLADPNFNVSGDIGVLLGSDIFWSVIGSEQIQLGPNLPILQNSKFGYIVAGHLNVRNLSRSSAESLSCLSVSEPSACISNEILKFWEIEETNYKNLVNMSESEKYCEHYFEKTVKKDESGRFIVKIPFKNNLHKLGDSREMALKRFNSMEKKLNNNKELKNEYVAFMSEYNKLGHMSELEQDSDDGYYLPHHAVIKDSSITTKCRVVFDASAKTTTGVSLNDVQFVGPTLQQDILSILMRFRIYAYVLTGDISKMYRQVLISPDETKYQKIFWRSQCNDPLKVYKLNTIIYGTASAPYLAVKCLFQIAKENESDFPLASKIIKRDFYMDDILTGSNSISELLEIQRDILSLLANHGFELRKFLSNKKEVLKMFEVNKDLDVGILNIGENEQSKTLGV